MIKCLTTIQIELEFEEKPLVARTRTNNKLNPHIAPSSGIKPGPHWREESSLTTAPFLLPLLNVRALQGWQWRLIWILLILRSIILAKRLFQLYRVLITTHLRGHDKKWHKQIPNRHVYNEKVECAFHPFTGSYNADDARVTKETKDEYYDIS